MRTSNHHPDHLQLNPNPTLLARAANPTHVRSGVEKGVKNHSSGAPEPSPLTWLDTSSSLDMRS